MTEETDPKSGEDNHSLVPTKAKEVGESLKDKISPSLRTWIKYF